MTKILVVDDKPVFRSRLEAAVSGDDREVTIAGSLEEALRLIEENDFAIVVTDLGLKGGPGEEGLEVIKAAKAKDVYTQVIAVSTYTNPEVNAKAMDLGAYTYLQRKMPAPEFQHEVASNVQAALDLRRKMLGEL